MGTAIEVSIIVVNYNTPKLTETLLESIIAKTTGVEFEIIVVDNGSEHERRYTNSKQWPQARLILSEKNLGFARAANLGAREAKGKYLLFANSDCRLTTDIIPEMVKHMERDGNCANCSPRLLSEDGTAHSSIRNFPTHKNIRHSRGAVFHSGATDDYTLVAETTRKRVDAMAATFMLTRRNMFEEIGGFDERFFMYVEDTDLCRRYADSGWNVSYLGDLTVMHKWGGSTRLHPYRMIRYHHCSVGKYFYKHYPQSKWDNLILTAQLSVNLIFSWAKLLFSKRKQAT